MPILLLVALLPTLLLSILVWHQRRLLLQRLALLEQLEYGAIEAGANGRVRWHNEAAARLLGSPAKPLRGTPLSDLIPEETLRTLAEPRRVRVRGADGQNRPLQISRTTGPRPLLLLRPVLAEAERFQHSQYFARIGTWDWDIDSNRLYWSDAIYAMFGYRVGEVTPSYELFCRSVHPDDREQVRAGERHCIETGENHDEEYRVVWPDGTVRWLRETGNVLKDDQGTPVKMMGVVRDITEEKDWASQMQQLAHHDPLTGLPNRLVFEDRLAGALERARRSQSRVALVFIDLNGFKAVNDRFGHKAGDQVLVAVATRLRDALRGSDSVARLGGDEFVALLEGLAPTRSIQEEAQAIADKLLAALGTPIQLASAQQQVGASLGIAFYPENAQSMDSLIHLADLAMYQAKRSGDNQFRLARAQGN